MRAEPTALSALPHPDRTLLRCLRAWVIGHVGRRPVTPHIDSALRRLGLGASAVHDLDAFMVALALGARRTLAIGGVCSDAVSADERLLLDALALDQRDAFEDAHDLFLLLVASRPACLAADAATRLTRSLLAAGHMLAAPSRQAPLPAHSPAGRVLH